MMISTNAFAAQMAIGKYLVSPLAKPQGEGRYVASVSKSIVGWNLKCSQNPVVGSHLPDETLAFPSTFLSQVCEFD